MNSTYHRRHFFPFIVRIGPVTASALPHGTPRVGATGHIPVYGEHGRVDVHYEHEIHVVLEGSGWFELADGQRLDARAGQIVMLPSHARHQFHARDAICLWSCNLHPDLFARLCPTPDDAIALALSRVAAGLAPRVFDDPHAFHTLVTLFEQAIVEYTHGDAWVHESHDLLGQLVAITMHRLMTTTHSAPVRDPGAVRVTAIQAWIDRHFCEPVAIEQLATMARMSPSHFTRTFSRVVGVVPKRYLIERRLAQARLLLRDTALSITTIALSVGCDSAASFSRLFRKYCALSPAAYRKKSRLEGKNDHDETRGMA